MIKHQLLFIVSFFFLLTVTAQDQQPVQFSFNKEDKGKGEYILNITAKPSPGVQLFSIDKISGDLPVNTVLNFDSSIKKYLQDSIVETGNLQTKNEAALDNATIKFYTDSLKWQQKIKLNPGDSIRIVGSINYYYKKGESIEAAEKRISMQFSYNEQKDIVVNPIVKNAGIEDESFLILLLLGIGAGLLAFITPCVYALVPVTVSLFLKRSKTALQGRKNVLFYAVSIILIYTAIGALASVVPKTFWNNLSTHWIFNLFLFLYLI